MENRYGDFHFCMFDDMHLQLLCTVDNQVCFFSLHCSLNKFLFVANCRSQRHIVANFFLLTSFKCLPFQTDIRSFLYKIANKAQLIGSAKHIENKNEKKTHRSTCVHHIHKYEELHELLVTPVREHQLLVSIYFLAYKTFNECL